MHVHVRQRCVFVRLIMRRMPGSCIASDLPAVLQVAQLDVDCVLSVLPLAQFSFIRQPFKRSVALFERGQLVLKLHLVALKTVATAQWSDASFVSSSS